MSKERIDQLETALREAIELIRECEPEYHVQGMGCGLEDRNITDRYEAMEHGWAKAIERIEEHFGDAADEFEAVLFVSVDEAETPKSELILEDADGAYISGSGGTTMEAAKEITEGKPLFWKGGITEARVPRDPIQQWTYNANGAYCPNCSDEDIRNAVAPLRERSGELPKFCSRCNAVCLHPKKGDRDGICNRTVCENEKAQWFNHSTRAWYCDDCARILNLENWDEAYRLYGHLFCTFGSGGARE